MGSNLDPPSSTHPSYQQEEADYDQDQGPQRHDTRSGKDSEIHQQEDDAKAKEKP